MVSRICQGLDEQMKAFLGRLVVQSMPASPTSIARLSLPRSSHWLLLCRLIAHIRSFGELSRQEREPLGAQSSGVQRQRAPIGADALDDAMDPCFT